MNPAIDTKNGANAYIWHSPDDDGWLVEFSDNDGRILNIEYENHAVETEGPFTDRPAALIFAMDMGAESILDG